MSRPGLSQPFEVAIVLGAPARPDGSPSPAQRRRVLAAVALVREGRAERLLMSGGPVLHPAPEAAMMRDLALAEGVAPERVLVEDRSINTIDNARRSGPIIAHHRWRRLALVTDVFHLPRALYVFRRFGLAATGIAAYPQGWPRSEWWLAWGRELLALPWTLLRVEARRWFRGA